MDDLFSTVFDAVFEALAHPWLRATAVVLASGVAAKVLDVVISRILIRITLRTDTDLDDQLIELLHRPVFTSVILVGLWAAVRILKLDADIAWAAVASIQTAGIFIWTAAGFRLATTSLTGLSRLADRVTWLVFCARAPI